MAALAADSPRTYKAPGAAGYHEVAASAVFYKGSALAVDSLGRVSALTAPSGVFTGFALEGANNTGGAAGDRQVQVLYEGILKDVTVASSGSSAVGALVYMSSDNDLTTVSTSNVLVGRLVKQAAASSTTWDVQFEAASERSPA